MTPTDRALMPDYLRLIALFGIVIVNILGIAFSFEKALVLPIGETLVDQAAGWFVVAFAAMKSFSLFSFTFGVGLGFLMRAAERKGQALGRLYRNRMIGLFLLGMAHGCLFFPGDILVTYALFGAVLYLCRNWPVRRLIWGGVILLALHILIFAPLVTFIYAVTPADEMVDYVLMAQEQQVLTQGTVSDVLAFRTGTYVDSLPFILLGQGSQVLAWFWFGLAAVKAGAIDAPQHPVWRRARVVFLVPGVLASVVAAWFWQWGDLALGLGLSYAAAPIASIGYLGVIAALARPPGPWMARALVAGRNSLSIYLGQSIVLSTIFASYGLGLWGRMGPMGAVLTAIGVTVLLIAALSLWMRRFDMGPFEWVLRRFTYLGQPRA